MIKYGYFFSFIILIFLFTSKVVIIGPLVIEYLIRLSENAKKEEYSRKWAWAFFLGAFTAIYGINVLNYRYYIISIIVITLIAIRKGSLK
jgi:hypothetical protein